MARTQNALHAGSPQTGEVVIRGAILALSCAISYWLITHILANTYSISRDDDLLGGMWAVVATIFVCGIATRRACGPPYRAWRQHPQFRIVLGVPFDFPVSRLGHGRADRDRYYRRNDNGPSGRHHQTGITIAVVMVVAALEPTRRLATADLETSRYRCWSRPSVLRRCGSAPTQWSGPN